MGPRIDLLGCEYLGGCPTVGSRVLNKVELHFDTDGLIVAIAPQGLFTLAAARPVLDLAWSEITVLSAMNTRLSATNARPGPAPHSRRRRIRSVVNVLTMRLDLPDQLAIGTPTWTMTVGVRMAASDLTTALQELLASRDGPAPAVTAK